MSITLSDSRSRAAPAPGLLRWLYDALATMTRLTAQRRARRELAVLSDAALHDLGLRRGDVQHEVERPIWQPIDIVALEVQRRRNARRNDWA